MQHLAIIFCLVFGVSIANAERERLIGIDFKTREAKSYRIKPGYGIYVVKYQADSKTFLVRLENAPAVGPNITTLEWLLESIDNGSTAKSFKRHPQRLVGGYYKTQKILWLLTEDELAEREAKAKR